MNRTNQILMGLLALQVVALLGMSLTGGDSLSVDRVELVSLDPDKVTRLKIEGSGEDAVTLERSGTDWVVASADAFPAKSSDVEAAVKKLARIESRNQVLSSSRYHEKLEVSPDSFQRKITLTHDGKDTVLYMGTSPSFKNTHVRVEGDDAVYLVNDLGTSDAGARAWNWVDRTYLEIPEDQVWSVAVENDKGSLRLDRDPASDTWAALGVNQALDAAKVKKLVKAARQVNLEAPISTSSKPEFGLEDPAATVTLTVGTSTIAGMPPPSTKSRKLFIGQKTPNASRRYVKAEGESHVVTVNESALQPLLENGTKDLLPDEDEP